MSELSSRSGRRPGTVTAGALLTWCAGGFLTVFGAALLIAALADAARLAQALAQTTGLASTASTSTHRAVGAGLLVAGVLPSVLAIAAFRRSRAGLVALTVAAGVFAAAVIALGLVREEATLSLLLSVFALVWVGLTTGLLRWRKDWYGRRPPAPDGAGGPDQSDGAGGPDQSEGAGGPDQSEGARTRPAGSPPVRPRTVAAGAGLVWIAGGALLAVGARLTWSGFSALLDPDSTDLLPEFGAVLGLAIAALGVVLVVLAGTTFTGSQDTLVALTVVALTVLGIFVVAILSAEEPLTTALGVLGAGWLVAATVLLWSRPSREWYQNQPG